MLRLLGKLPRKVYLATSGGIDSMASYDFLSRNHEVIPVFFNHGTDESNEAEFFLQDYFRVGCPGKKGIPKLISGKIKNPNKPKDKSWEEYWREERYKFFREVITMNTGSVDFGWTHIEQKPFFITCHHLSDAAAGYLFSALHGTPKLLEYWNGLIYRPFLLNTKKDLLDWAEKHKVPYLEADSNKDVKFKRNLINIELLPKALEVNPGFLTVIRKKILNRFPNTST